MIEQISASLVYNQSLNYATACESEIGNIAGTLNYVGNVDKTYIRHKRLIAKLTNGGFGTLSELSSTT